MLQAMLGKFKEVSRCNHLRQAGASCGWWVCHYAELEVRRLHGEGGAPVTSPSHSERMQAMMAKVRAASVQLEKARLKWMADEKMEEMKLASLESVLAKKVNRLRAAEREVAALRERAANAAQVSLWMRSLPDPIPEDPKVRKRMLAFEASKELKAKVKKAVEAMLNEEKTAEEKKKTKMKEGKDKEAEEEKPDEAEEDKEAEEEKPAEKEKAAELVGLKTKGEKGFEAWLRALPLKTLEVVYEHSLLMNAGAAYVRDYVEYMKTIESVRICSKCNWQTGCVACSSEHAMRYAIRTGEPPMWWRRTTMKVLRGMCK